MSSPGEEVQTEVEGVADDGSVPQEPTDSEHLESTEEEKEPAGEPQRPPEYLSREAFEAAMGEQARYVNNAVNGLSQQMQQLYRRLEQVPQPQKKEGHLIPDSDEFAAKVTTPEHLQGLLANMYSKLEDKVTTAVEKFEKAEQARAEKERTQQYYDYMMGEIDRAAQPYGLLQKPEAKRFLQTQVAAELNANGSDINKISLPAIAKKTNEILKSLTTPAAPPAPKPGHTRIPPGPGSKPALPEIDLDKQYTDVEFENLQRSSLEQLEKLYQEAQGE